MDILAQNVPAELKARRQWVLWRYEERDGKPAKVPYQAGGQRASSTVSATWATWQRAWAAFQDGGFDGIGFVLSADDPYTAVDLDAVKDKNTGKVLESLIREDGSLVEWAADIVCRLDSYTEVSPGGAGIRLWVKAKLPPQGRKRGQFEAYDAERFMTVTGKHLDGTPWEIMERQAEVEAVHAKVFGPTNKSPTPVKPQGLANLDDDALIHKAMSGRNGDAFRRLWEGDISAYPSPSEADLALCSHLAFWTGGDAGRVDALFRQSGLMRPKWDEKHGARSYGAMTITRALEEGTPNRGRSRAQRMVELALASGVELWHTMEGGGYLTITVGGHQENWPLEGRATRDWLARLLWEDQGRPATNQYIQDALGVLRGKARWDGAEHVAHVRVAGHEGVIYIDLANDQWQAVEITPLGWRVVDSPPVRFRRPSTMRPLPKPQHGGKLDDLRPFLNIHEGDWPLIAGYLLAALRPVGPYPPLCVHGEQGSAKSTLSKVLRSLIDPHHAPLRRPPTEPRDLLSLVSNSWCLALDNITSLPAWLSDDLARLSTGGGIGERTLYTNDEESVIDAQRPVILTAIGEVVDRPDLLDRSMVIFLPNISEEKRRSEQEFWATFESAKPRILGALLESVAQALYSLPSVKLASKPRMADFAEWVVAGEEGLGLMKGDFLKSYERNRQEAQVMPLEAPLPQAVLRLIEQKKVWEGTATALLEALEAMLPEGARKPRLWPGSASVLSRELRALAPPLRATGVDVSFGSGGRGKGKHREVTLRKVGIKGVPSVPVVPTDTKERETLPSPQVGVPSPLQSDGDGGDGGDGISPNSSNGPTARRKQEYTEVI